MTELAQDIWQKVYFRCDWAKVGSEVRCSRGWCGLRATGRQGDGLYAVGDEGVDAVLLFDFAFGAVDAGAGYSGAVFSVYVGEEDYLDYALAVLQSYEFHVFVVLRDGAAAGDQPTYKSAAFEV